MGLTWRGLIACLALSVSGWMGVARADIVQITDLPNPSFLSAPSINADARDITFATSADVAGLNPTPVENVFVYDMPTNTFTRVTSQGGSDPTINADGTWVAFTSSADYARRNADGSDEIFRCNLLRRAFYQLTNDRFGDGSSALAVIDGSGKTVAYETTSDLRGGNLDLSPEVFLFRRARNSAVSIDPVGDGESHSPTVSSDGNFVAFQSTSNLTGNNADLSQELMLYDAKQRRLTQVTNDPNGDGDSGNPALSADGHFLTFLSSSNVAGLNPDGATAVYLMNRFRGFTVVSKTAGGVFDGDTPTISGDGRWVAFVTNFDATGGNPDHNTEIVIYDRFGKTFTQLTDSTACINTNPKFSADGTHVAFVSRCDYTGGNPDHSPEVFLADNPLSYLQFHSEGPVSLLILDPNGLPIGSTFNYIPRATYERGDFNGDGQPEVRVTIPQAVQGIYRITTTPDVGAPPDAPVTADVTLNGVTATLANDSVSGITSQTLTFDNQDLRQRSARIVPLTGTGSVIRLSAKLDHPTAASGPVTVHFTDGIGDVFFDFGRLENLYGTGRTKSFDGVVNGFLSTLQITESLDGSSTSTRFAAHAGDLSMFAGTSDVSMVMVVQIGPDTSMYYWRFKRQTSGALLLLPPSRP